MTVKVLTRRPRFGFGARSLVLMGHQENHHVGRLAAQARIHCKMEAAEHHFHGSGGSRRLQDFGIDVGKIDQDGIQQLVNDYPGGHSGATGSSFQ